MAEAPDAVPTDGIRVSSDPGDLDIDWIHGALSERAYWALGRTRDTVAASLRHSLCFSALEGARQVGLARVVTDQATFAWVCDVFVDEAYRGRGIGQQLMAAIVADERLQSVRRMLLTTSSAAPLYERFGFVPLDHPERWLVRRRGPDAR